LRPIVVCRGTTVVPGKGLDALIAIVAVLPPLTGTERALQLN
jgi:hypothetical protein